MRRIEINLLIWQTALLLTLVIFSYSYVDLNLTLTKNTLLLEILKKLQFLGYYKRPDATLFYILLVSGMFITFALNLFLVNKNKLSVKYLSISTIISTILLIPSYPFLSSDLFNYMFDAKIVTFYGSNPYTHRPLDFPADEWLRFMRWVHRYSPYGPLWLGLSIVPSMLGLGKFITTLLAFKLFIGAVHLLNSWLIYRTLKEAKSSVAIFGTTFYALNPLFLIEGIANAHNDIVHAFFIILSVYFIVLKKSAIRSSYAILASALVKYLALLSVFPLIIWRFTKYNKVDHYVLLNLGVYALFTFVYSTFTISVPFISSGSLQTQFQPWYLFWTLPLIAFVSIYKRLVVVAFLVGLFAELRYIPYLYYGDWGNSITIPFMHAMVVIPVVISAGLILQKSLLDRLK